MRTRITLCALAALSLAACQKKAETGPPAAPAADATAPAAEATDSAADLTAAPKASHATRTASAQTPLPNLSIPQLAYAYKYALAAPPKDVRRLMSKHEQVCWAAGPAVCQVTGSNVSENGPDQVSATLTLRAQPAWLRTFRAGLEDDTKAVGGRMVTADTSSDDLSRSIVDGEATLRAKTALRDRLQEALRTRPGKISDVFDLEQQLSQVQGEIDAGRSELAMMKTRVATSELRIDYRSEGVLAPSGVFQPVGQAAADVVGIFVAVLAFLIRAGAVIVPLAGVGALGWWIVRVLTPKKPRKAPAA